VRGPAWGRVMVGALLIVAGAAAAASAEERLRFGTKDVSIAGGYSFSHSTAGRPDLESVDSFQLIPHFGYVLSDERGPGWVRGNFELLAEPTLVHLSSRSESATAVGLSLLARWIFATDWVVRPYLEVGGGILAGQLEFRQTNCDVNYVLEGGPGLLWFLSDQLAVTAGYRFQHISNARSCDKNLGLNSSFFSVGISYFFP
jgi:hypothetical protein